MDTAANHGPGIYREHAIRSVSVLVGLHMDQDAARIGEYRADAPFTLPERIWASRSGRVGSA